MMASTNIQHRAAHTRHPELDAEANVNHGAAPRCLAVLVMLLAACLGCHHGPFPVSGEVTFDGNPVDEGTISFEPADGIGSATGGKITAGKYALTDKAAPQPGKKIVRIFAVRKTGRHVTDRLTGTVEAVEPYIPDVYNARSILTCEVASDGACQIDFALDSRQKEAATP